MSKGSEKSELETKPTKRAVFYARVSTGKQALKETPIQGQLDAMNKYASEEGFTVIAEYIERGASAKRPRPVKWCPKSHRTFLLS